MATTSMAARMVSASAGSQMGLTAAPVAVRKMTSGRLLRMSRPLTHATMMVVASARWPRRLRLLGVVSICSTIFEGPCRDKGFTSRGEHLQNQGKFKKSGWVNWHLLIDDLWIGDLR